MAPVRHCTRTHVTKAETIIYRSRQSDCASCPTEVALLPEHTRSRKITRSIYEAARNVARDIAKTRLYRQSRKDRKKVEMLFAHLKRILNLTRLRLRGMNGARDEFCLQLSLRTSGAWRNPGIDRHLVRRSQQLKGQQHKT